VSGVRFQVSGRPDKRTPNIEHPTPNIERRAPEGREPLNLKLETWNLKLLLLLTPET
jgi:hypothetical protein